MRRSAVLVVILTVALLTAAFGGTSALGQHHRGCFYYPWYGGAGGAGWNQQGMNPFTKYAPTRGYYDTRDLATVEAQVADMQYANCDVGIASWWGKGSFTDQSMPTLTRAANATAFHWAIYYEPSGQTQNISVTRIVSDVTYLRSHYGSGLLRVGANKAIVIFVYNALDTTQALGCQTAANWASAKRRLAANGIAAYVDLKVFPGFSSCANQPDGWHQYGPATQLHDFSSAPGDGSMTLSPGYYKANELAPRLMRDIASFQGGLTTIASKHVPWELVTTYNEWGEGTAVEASSGCQARVTNTSQCSWTSAGGHSTYTDVMHTVPVDGA